MMALHIPPSSTDALLSLSRQESHIQSHLQTLLDAQSFGLLAGLGRADEGSVGSTTPPSSSAAIPPRSKSVTPVRQPKSKTVGLRGARRGISRAIDDLAVLKGQQSEILEADLEERGKDLDVIDNFIRKNEGLQEAIQDIEGAPTTSRIGSLRSEEQALSTEITELETKLYQMKARHRHILREISDLDNSIQSKLSSYRDSLTIAEKEARSFLSRPPAYVAGLNGNEKGFWALPTERRTLEMAGEDLRGRRDNLRTRWREAEGERVALEEGSKVWSEVCSMVGEVEQGLREEMRVMHGSVRENGNTMVGMGRVLELMDRAKGDIEEKLSVAEKKNWRLLVCCIGAELEAIMEGEGVLRGALEEAGGGEQLHGRDLEELHGSADELHGLERSRLSDNGVRLTQPSPKLLRGSQEEDDEPGPDLLIAHQDAD